MRCVAFVCWCHWTQFYSQPLNLYWDRIALPDSAYKQAWAVCHCFYARLKLHTWHKMVPEAKTWERATQFWVYWIWLRKFDASKFLHLYTTQTRASTVASCEKAEQQSSACSFARPSFFSHLYIAFSFLRTFSNWKIQKIGNAMMMKEKEQNGRHAIAKIVHRMEFGTWLWNMLSCAPKRKSSRHWATEPKRHIKLKLKRVRQKLQALLHGTQTIGI